MRGGSQGLQLSALVAACSALGCSQPLELGNDLLWSATQESGDLEHWLADGNGGARLPNERTIAEVSSEAAHSGRYSLRLVNPTDWNNQEDGPELYRVAGPLSDAYYSAWFLLPEQYRLEPSMTIMRLRSRAAGSDELLSGEELQLRSLPTGGYVLQVLSNNASFLLEPLAEPAPRVEAARWFQLEARFEPRSGGRLRIWLDGSLVYDLPGRPAAAGDEVVLGVCNVAELASPAPLVLFVDDAAISLSRVTPNGAVETE